MEKGFVVKFNGDLGFIEVTPPKIGFSCFNFHTQIETPEGIEEVCESLTRDEIVELKVKLEMLLESTR